MDTDGRGWCPPAAGGEGGNGQGNHKGTKTQRGGFDAEREEDGAQTP